MSEVLEKVLGEIQTLAGIVAFVNDPEVGKKLTSLAKIVADYKETTRTFQEDKASAASLRDEASRLLREAKIVQDQTQKAQDEGIVKATALRDESFKLRDSGMIAQSNAERFLQEVKVREAKIGPRELILKEREAVLEAAQKETDTLKGDLERRLGILAVAGAPRK